MLDDLLQPNLDVVICGTAAGAQSAARNAYYAGPGNKFWAVLYRTGLTPVQLNPAQYRELPRYRIGLTDIVKEQAGNDDVIDFSLSVTSKLRRAIEELSPAILAFNGKKAAQVFLGKKKVEFGLQAELVGPTKLFVVPSTSGAANGYWDEEYWHDLASLVRVTR